MDWFFMNKYIQALLVFLAIIGAFTVYQSMHYYTDTVAEVVLEEPTEDMANMGPMEYSSDLDLTGLHIMTNGDVMTGAGIVITDAVIEEDGMITFSDGSSVEPTMDMRLESKLKPAVVPVIETESAPAVETNQEENVMMGDGTVLFSTDLDLRGTHIMANGDVMTGAGTVISDAVIREDGMIEFPDGSEIEPVFDMRP